MNDTFYTSLIGAKTFSKAIDIVGHNISNSNLAGYRAKSVEFSNIFTQNLNASGGGAVSSQKEYGSQIQTSVMSQRQGALTTTDSTFDLAIEGNGWFGLQTADGTVAYTRNGGFNIDKERYLVDYSGQYVTGTMANNIVFNADATNNRLTNVVSELDLGVPTNQTKLRLPNMLTYPKKVTDEVTITGNLGTADEERKFSSTLVSSADEVNTVSVTMVKSATQPTVGSSWDAVATVTNADGTVTFDKKSGTLVFDGNGRIKSSTMPSVSNDGNRVSLNFGKGSAGLQANDSADVAFTIAKNGNPEGELSTYGVMQNGDIVALFDNGFKTVVAKVAIYHFHNEQGLQDVGASFYRDTTASGEPIFYRDDAGELITTEGLVLEHSLEESNIDNATALSSLMILQKAFDASSRALKAGDDMIKQALSMDA
ncbi:Flagellar hook-basal body protein FlgE [Thiovulum sp. ES]|nr:Flagellar hook-basal body protein FlgE [Thiovulum sp. ES]